MVFLAVPILASADDTAVVDSTTFSGLEVLEGFSIGFEGSGVRDKQMDQSDGLKPLFDQYRIESDRWFFVIGYQIIEQIGAYIKLGSADLKTHSNEGETVEFDEGFAWVIGVKGTCYEHPEGLFRLNASLSYLSFEADNGSTTHVPKDDRLTSNAKVDWQEIEFAAEIEKDFKNFKGRLGVRFLDITADQDADFPGTSVSSSFDADENVGLYAGLDVSIIEELEVKLTANIIDERKFTVGLFYSF
jgi:hypothetical protein